MYYWENRNNLLHQSNISAYILEVIKHKCLNYLRHMHVRENVKQHILTYMQRVNNLRIATLEACNPQELFSIEAQELIDQALAMMPEKTRQIFMMSRCENETYQDISRLIKPMRRSNS